MPQRSKVRLRPEPNAPSPTMPLSRAMVVLPIWMVEKNCVGLSCSRITATAPLSPLAANVSIRTRRLDTTAISVMENTPLRKVRKAISRMSIIVDGTLHDRRRAGLQRRPGATVGKDRVLAQQGHAVPAG